MAKEGKNMLIGKPEELINYEDDHDIYKWNEKKQTYELKQGVPKHIQDLYYEWIGQIQKLNEKYSFDMSKKHEFIDDDDEEEDMHEFISDKE